MSTTPAGPGKPTGAIYAHQDYGGLGWAGVHSTTRTWCACVHAASAQLGAHPVKGRQACVACLCACLHACGRVGMHAHETLARACAVACMGAWEHARTHALHVSTLRARPHPPALPAACPIHNPRSEMGAGRVKELRLPAAHGHRGHCGRRAGASVQGGGREAVEGLSEEESGSGILGGGRKELSLSRPLLAQWCWQLHAHPAAAG